VADYLVKVQPGECLVRAASYLLEHGYSMDYSKDDHWGESLTLSRSPEIELNSPETCLIVAGAFLSTGLLLVLLLLGIVTGVWKRRATLVVALPTQDSGRTLLTTSGSNKKVEEALVVMVHDEFGGQFIPVRHT
jgi:hypothetical protein